MNYKVRVNHKFCSDLYPILNVEVAVHSFAVMSIFMKIRLGNSLSPDTNRVPLQRSDDNPHTDRFIEVDKNAVWNKNG